MEQGGFQEADPLRYRRPEKPGDGRQCGCQTVMASEVGQERRGCPSGGMFSRIQQLSRMLERGA
jgi:hypothetical protein